ncbi:MAG TPA: HEAT repeat domain-containing protein [Verrucomicrobiae bacterium]|jgi:hypothetical protein|nr:HEAT repeat domain-containing protein [Verrucomicrobiae bacterium]
MRKRIRIVLVIAGVVIASVLVLEALRPREPVYQGRKLSQWLNDYNRAGKMDKTAPASDAIRAMGTNTLPFLLAHIKHRDSRLQEKFFNLLGRQHWAKLPFYGADPYKSTSIFALSVLGSNAAPLCPELLKIAEQPDGRWWGTMSLLAIGPASAPTLAKACQNTSAHWRTYAVLIMAMQKTMGPPRFSCGWIPAPVNHQPMFILGYAVSEPDLEGLLDSARPSFHVVEELINMLANPDGAVRRASAEAIGLYTKPPYTGVAKSAVKPLVKALRDPDADVRLAAEHTLKAIDPIAAGQAGAK